VSGVLSVNGIATCRLASQGIWHVLRDGFRSVHAMPYSVSHAKVLCRKAPACVTLLALYPLPYALPRLLTVPHSRQKAMRSFLGGMVSRKNSKKCTYLGFVAHFAQEVVQRLLPRSVEGMRRPERRPVRSPCGPRCPLRAPAAVSGAGAGVRGRRACTTPRPTLCTRAADAGAVVRLSGPAPPEGGARGRDGGRSPGRAPPARACWPLPGPPSRPWGAAPARRGGQAPAAATAGRPARPGPRCGARRWSDPVERRRAHAPGP